MWDDFEPFGELDDTEWPRELQQLVDMGLVNVKYDEEDVARFSLSDEGKALYQETDPELN